MVSGDQRAGADAGLDHQGAGREGGDHPVADREAPAPGLGPQGELADHRTAFGDGPAKLAVSRGVGDVDATAEDGHRPPLRSLQGGPVGGGVDAAGKSGDYGHAGLRQLPGEEGSRLQAVGGRGPGADDGDRRGLRDLPQDIEHRRRQLEVLKLRGVALVGHREEDSTGLRSPILFAPGGLFSVPGHTARGLQLVRWHSHPAGFFEPRLATARRRPLPALHLQA